MDSLVYSSNKKHRVIAVKKLLTDNEIPITSVKLHILLEWRHGGRRGGERLTEQMEKRDELDVQIEDFNEKLNDAQTLELYTYENFEEAAINLIDNIDEETFFDDCLFKSRNYDETIKIYHLLRKNDIPCDDIYTNADEYLLFIEPEYKEQALQVMKQDPKKNFDGVITEYEYKNLNKNDKSNNENPENHDNKVIKFILPFLIILFILFLKINDELIIIIIFNKIKEIFGF